MDELVYTYDEAKNPDGAYLSGVPLRDLTMADVATLPEWLQRSIAACPFYKPTGNYKPPALIGDLPGIGQEIATALENAGFKTVTAVAAATDEQLLAIAGIGDGRLRIIRAALVNQVPAVAEEGE